MVDEQQIPESVNLVDGGILAIMEIKGRTLELLKAIDDYELEHPVRPKGQLVHMSAATPTGIIIYDVWDSQSALDAWLARSPGQPEPKTLSLHGVRFSRT